MSAIAMGITSRDIDELVGGLCAEADPEMFYPPANSSIAFEEAAKLCNRCPVSETCLAGARARGEQWGVWGGVNFEKDANAKPYNPADYDFCGTYAGYARHRKRDETACAECKAVKAAHERERAKRARLRIAS